MTEPESTGRDRLQRGFERWLALAQLTVLLPVLVLLLSAVGAFIYGTVVVVHFAVDIAHEPFAVHNLRLFLTEIDLYLIGATLNDRRVRLLRPVRGQDRPGGRAAPAPAPAWLAMNDLNDLKARVISMIILVTAVTFTDVVLEFNETIDILYLGVGVAVFIAALTAYLRFGGARD